MPQTVLHWHMHTRLRVFVHFSLDLIFSSLTSSINNCCLLPRWYFQFVAYCPKIGLFFLQIRSIYSTVIILFVRKVNSVLGIKIFIRALIAIIKKFNRILVFIFYKRNGIKINKIKRTFIDMNKLEGIAYSFVDILKSTSITKVICIYITLPIFSVRIKYFSIRWIIISYVIIHPGVATKN